MPDWRNEIRERLASLRLSAPREHDITEELSQHLEDRYADLCARGHGDAEAQRMAREELAREPLLHALAETEHPVNQRAHVPAGAPSAGSFVAGLWRDVRYGARTLRRAPGFTAVATLTLALGIGTTTAMFSVLDAVILRPLPFPEAEQLVRLYGTYGKVASGTMSFSAADFLAFRADGRALSSIATYQTPGDGFSFVSGDRAERVFGTVVSADFFKTLIVRPMIGRTFQAGDDADGAPPTVVLSHGFWQRRLGGDPSIVGKQLNIQGRPVTVIGVMPPSVWFPRGDRAEFWINDSFATPTRRGPFGWAAIGRVRPGASATQRQAVFDQIAAGIRSRFPGGAAQWTFVDKPLAEQYAGGLRPALLVLMGAVVLVLLIACLNLTNLLLARATTREQEIAVRTALGASRMTLLRQLLTESALLAVFGGAVGVLLAMWGVRVLIARAPDSLPMLRDLGVGVDARVLSLAAAAAMGSVLLFGLAPALLAAPASGGGSMRESARGATDARSRRRLRSTLVASEFALSLMLLVGAGLLIRSLSKLRAVNTGVRADGVVTASIALPKFRYDKPEQILSFHDRLLGELRALPGMEHPSASTGLPPDVFGSSSDFFVTSRPVPEGEFSPVAAVLSVDGEYFAAFGIPLRAGRVFDARDNPNGPPTVMISHALARRYFPNDDPVGQRLNIGGPGDANVYTIVGVVGDVRYAGVADSATIAMYQPFAQFSEGLTRSFSIVVRTPLAAGEVASLLRTTVRSIDPELAVARVRTVRDLVETSVGGDRFRTTLLGLFAMLALVLAAIGIYGVMAYAVGRRAREIGIRLALGARTRQVYALVLGEGLAVAGAGVAVGIVLALGATRVMSKLLFEVSRTDALTFLIVTLLLLAIAAIACIIPAGRAARVDPAITMRGE
ncbi:MAG: ABC transporter permease [Gemmatimonadota bacterium]|nr:ABC transporter permease [Gemmatimonadota bacterium]